MAKSKTILLWGSEDVLGSSIKNLLAVEGDWKVISLSVNDDLSTLKQALEVIHPDIVIIHQGNRNNSSNLALQLFQDHPAIKVISLGLENNLIEIYSKQKIWVKQSSDLIGLIENEP